jgi:hypothetical protein
MSATNFWFLALYLAFYARIVPHKRNEALSVNWCRCLIGVVRDLFGFAEEKRRKVPKVMTPDVPDVTPSTLDKSVVYAIFVEQFKCGIVVVIRDIFRTADGDPQEFGLFIDHTVGEQVFKILDKVGAESRKPARAKDTEVCEGTRFQ